ncbi:MAG: hypothetical protein OEL57_08185 [Trichlorobacter sp.]|uniref:hypothetical protein n=1 Tax=Trichlorobacter sp. TaxID=2911007 RepID=UPI00256DA9FC|nr:hypothetical protein [Trichlorobacter sp.]MDK9717871.1 hypothetical protein [Trichlorobacter sp.]
MFATAISVSQPSSSTILFSSRSADLMNRRGVSETEREEFAAILARAATGNAGNNPKAFLNSLSSNDREILRKVHCLADPISINMLDFEGAYNLLTAPGEAQDLDNDGLLSIGAGKMWQYPPPNAPAAVKQAWEEATAGIPESEKWLAMAPFMAASASANIKPDLSGFYEPGEAGYRNIYAEPNFSYTRQVRDILSMMDRFKGQHDAHYQKNKEFLLSFLKELTVNHAV